MIPPWMESFQPLESPPPTTWWPPAPGWWILLFVTLAALATGWYTWRRQRRRERYRQALRLELERLWQQHRPDLTPTAIDDYLFGCITALRQTWRLWSPTHAALPSRQLLEELEQTPGVTLPIPVVTDIERILYGRVDIPWPDHAAVMKNFHEQLLRWSRKHLRALPC